MKNKYVMKANRFWLAVVWSLSVALPTQAQTTQPPVVQWQRVIESSTNPGAVNARPVIIANSQGGYSVLTGDRRLLFLTSSGTITSDTQITGLFADLGTSPALSTADMAPASDGGVVVAVQDNAGWSLQKRNPNGSVTWVNRLQTYTNDYSYEVASVVASSDGGFVTFARYQDRNLAPGQVYVVVNKVDRDGAQVWNKSIRYPNASGTRVEQAISLFGGGYLLAGSTYTASGNSSFRGWAAKLDDQGNAIWQNRYEDMNVLNGVALYGDFDQSYVVNGRAFSTPPGLFATSSFVIDNFGNQINSIATGRVPSAAFNSASTIVNVPRSGRPPIYAVANDTPLNMNGGDIRLTSFSDQGAVVWTKTLGGSSRDYAYRPSVVATNNGFVVVGITESTDGDVKGKENNLPATWIVKLEEPTKTFTLSQPFYNCQTGLIDFAWFGGDGSPITFNAPGVSRSSATSNRGIVELGLRNDPKPITITATQSGQSDTYTFDFSLYCNGTQRPVVDTPIPDMTLTVGIGLSTTVNQYFNRDRDRNLRFTSAGLPPGLYSFEEPALSNFYISGNPTTAGVYTVTVTATNTALMPPNNSASATFKITVVDIPVVNPPTPHTGGTLALTQPSYNCQTGAITFNTTGGDGSTITYNAPGISRSSATSNSGTVEPGLRNDPKPITIMATQNEQTVSFTFDLAAFCSSTQPPVVNPPAPPVSPPTPPAGGTLTLLAPTYDCATGAISFRTSGGNGSPIEYMAPGITGWTTNPNQFVDRDSRTASDVKPFTLMARQNGAMVSYVWDLRAACGRARVGVGERMAELSVSVLGNPVSDAVLVEVQGAQNKPLSLRLIDGRGRLVESRSVEQAGAVERQRFDVHQQGPGLLLLRVSSGTQTRTVKIMKQ